VKYGTVMLNLRSFVELVWYRVGMREKGGTFLEATKEEVERHGKVVGRL
jgi:hypothetical protein